MITSHEEEVAQLRLALRESVSRWPVWFVYNDDDDDCVIDDDSYDDSGAYYDYNDCDKFLIIILVLIIFSIISLF